MSLYESARADELAPGDRSRLAEAIDRDRRRYLSSAELAEAVGVSRSTITASLRRHGPLSARPFPEPDVWIGTAPGWRRGRVAEVRAWFAERRRGRARSRVEELHRAEEV